MKAVFSFAWTSGRRANCLRLILGFALVMAMPMAARALPTFPPIFLAAYHPKQGGAVSSAASNCSLCHSGPPKLNAYGMDVRAALTQANTKTLTPDILKSVESKDSDGDGFPNGAEIAADTLPGDSSSKPAGASPSVSQTTTGAGKTSASADSSTTAAGAEDDGPFALKTLLMPRHAQHPVIVHFPIALYIISLLFDLLAVRKRSAALATAAYYNLTAAAVTAPLSVVTGLVAWQWAYGGAPLQGWLLYHLLLGLVTTALLGSLWYIRSRSKSEAEPKLSTTYLALSVITFFVIALTGHLGGTLAGLK